MDVMKNYFVEVRYAYQVLLGDWLNCDQIVIRESKVNIANNNALTVYMSNCFNQNTGYVFESRELHLLPF